MNVLFSLLLLLAPLKAESGRFTILQDGRKLGVEDFSLTPQRGGYLVEGHTVINDGSRSFDLRSAMELNAALQVTSYQFRTTGSSIDLTVTSDASHLETNVQGQRQSDDVQFPKDGVIIDSNFFHHFAILIHRIRATPASGPIPAFVPQELQLAPITVKVLGPNAYEIDTGNVKVEATTDSEGRLLRLSVPSAKVVVERS